jgi:hypothetical protein
MQTELFVFPISAEAQARLNRKEVAGALESALDTQTHLRNLPDHTYGAIKMMGLALVGALDEAERAYRGRAA